MRGWPRKERHHSGWRSSTGVYQTLGWAACCWLAPSQGFGCTAQLTQVGKKTSNAFASVEHRDQTLCSEARRSSCLSLASLISPSSRYTTPAVPSPKQTSTSWLGLKTTRTPTAQRSDETNKAEDPQGPRSSLILTLFQLGMKRSLLDSLAEEEAGEAELHPTHTHTERARGFSGFRFILCRPLRILQKLWRHFVTNPPRQHQESRMQTSSDHILHQLLQAYEKTFSPHHEQRKAGTR